MNSTELLERDMLTILENDGPLTTVDLLARLKELRGFWMPVTRSQFYAVLDSLLERRVLVWQWKTLVMQPPIKVYGLRQSFGPGARMNTFGEIIEINGRPVP